MFESSWPQLISLTVAMSSHKKVIFSVESVALVANGVIHDFSLIAKLIKNYDRVVAVDGGLIHCHEMNIRPDFIIGDFDSATPELLKYYQDIPSQKFPTEKDQTDLQLAVEAFNSTTTKKIGIFGALERRMDHALNNLILMCRFLDKIVLETEIETLLVITDKKEISCNPGQRLSLIPLCSPAEGVTTKGLQWELKDATLDKNFCSVSNVCLTSSIHIEIRKGELICCLARI